MRTFRNLSVAFVATLSFLLPQALIADFYVIPIKPKTAGPGCVAYNGLEYCEIVSATTARTWLDRNLGSPKVCSAFDDAECYGDYYQWGRYADGHEKSNSLTRTTLATSLVASEGKFITNTTTPRDWVASGVDDDGSLRGGNWNPCPSGYRVPIESELIAEGISNRADAFSKLKLPSAGRRYCGSGTMYNQGSDSYVWSSSPDGARARYLYFYSDNAYTHYNYRTNGFSVRCLKE